MSDDPARYGLRVEGVGLFKFESTEFGAVEFGTAIALVTSLQPDLRYRYRVVRAGRFVRGANGSFRRRPTQQVQQHFHSDSVTRRRAMAEMYRLNWSRDPVRQVLANVPRYMVWDDHDIRDGWGSLASDSPIAAAQYPQTASVAPFRMASASGRHSCSAAVA